MNRLNEGFLARLTKEYVGETTRDENRINIDGVDCFHSFTDMNGKFHKYGYKVTNGDIHTLYTLVYELVKKRGEKADLNDIDVSNMEDIGRLFEDMEFDGNLSGWDVSNVTDFYAMFSNSTFNNHSIDNWKLNTKRGKKVDLSFMFHTSDHRQKKDLSNIDVSKWKTSNVYNFNGIFYNSNFNGDLSKWKVRHGKSFGYMFKKCDFNNHSIDNWKFSNEKNIYINFDGMFSDGVRSNLDLSNWNTESVDSFFEMFADSTLDCDISNWDISNGNTKDMFKNCNIKEEFKPIKK